MKLYLYSQVWRVCKILIRTVMINTQGSIRMLARVHKTSLLDLQWAPACLLFLALYIKHLSPLSDTNGLMYALVINIVRRRSSIHGASGSDSTSVLFRKRVRTARDWTPGLGSAHKPVLGKLAKEMEPFSWRVPKHCATAGSLDNTIASVELTEVFSWACGVLLFSRQRSVGIGHVTEEQNYLVRRVAAKAIINSVENYTVRKHR